MYYFVYRNTNSHTYSQNVMERWFKKRVINKIIRGTGYGLHFSYDIKELESIRKSKPDLIRGYIVAIHEQKAAMMLRMDPKRITSMAYQFGFHIDDMTPFDNLYGRIQAINNERQRVKKSISEKTYKIREMNRVKSTIDSIILHHDEVVTFFDREKYKLIVGNLENEECDLKKQLSDLEKEHSKLVSDIEELFNSKKFI